MNPRPQIIVDSREQCPLVFRNLPSAVGTLITGDYSFAGAEELFAIERKSIADLVASVSAKSTKPTIDDARRTGAS
ncbi:MAG TPA: hypothetical protein PLX89_07505 [Verrucomicrobiota bacterium]|nr:hypothetical protein [Verrucomicrobiales bacterium]HRI12835.1 hypothetical protein [Verrucomicrobiota bacterium]